MTGPSFPGTSASWTPSPKYPRASTVWSWDGSWTTWANQYASRLDLHTSPLGVPFPELLRALCLATVLAIFVLLVLIWRRINARSTRIQAKRIEMEGRS